MTGVTKLCIAPSIFVISSPFSHLTPRAPFFFLRINNSTRGRGTKSEQDIRGGGGMKSPGFFSSLVEGRTASREHDRNFSLAKIDEGWSASDLSKLDGDRLVGTLGFMIKAILVSLQTRWEFG
jgi:hypothetical protein